MKWEKLWRSGLKAQDIFERDILNLYLSSDERTISELSREAERIVDDYIDHGIGENSLIYFASVIGPASTISMDKIFRIPQNDSDIILHIKILVEYLHDEDFRKIIKYLIEKYHIHIYGDFCTCDGTEMEQLVLLAIENFDNVPKK